MTLRTDPAWPPDSYADPMSYDYRGCCWPWGPCGRVRRAEMRCVLQGYKAGVPHDPPGGPELSQALGVIDVVSSSFLDIVYSQNPLETDFVFRLDMVPVDEVEGSWLANLVYTATLPVVGTLLAEGSVDDGFCSASGCLIPVSFATAWPDPPDAILIRSLPFFAPLVP